MQKQKIIMNIIFKHKSTMYKIIYYQLSKYYSLPIEADDVFNESLPKVYELYVKFDKEVSENFESFLVPSYRRITMTIIKKYARGIYKPLNEANLAGQITDNLIDIDEPVRDTFNNLLKLLTKDERLIVYRAIILEERKPKIKTGLKFSRTKFNNLLNSIASKLKSLNDI